MQLVPKELLDELLEGMKNVGEGWKVPPIPVEVFNVNEDDREWVNSQYTMQPIETLQQRTRLSGGIDKIENITFVRATGYELVWLMSPFYEKARAKGWKTFEMACGHDVMLDQPQELSRLLLNAATL